jgi:CelD/BcsL family acetyltransferase involved in cellulose biosynthesis
MGSISAQESALNSETLSARVVDDVTALEPYIEAWDELAVERERPCCAPAWMLSWWHEGRTADARLRVILAFDERELVGVGPFFAQVNRVGLAEMRLLSAGFSHRIGPLAKRGRDRAVAATLARTLAGMRPRPASVVFEGVDLAESWPTLVADSWPGRRPRLRTDEVMPGSVIRVDGSFDAWFARRSRGFRKSARRNVRRLERASVKSRIACDTSAIDTLLDLHHARWSGRGGSRVAVQTHDVLRAAARRFSDPTRLQVVLLEGPAGAVAAELVVRAGRTASFWGGGFDPRWSQDAPGTQAILESLHALAGQGTTIADLGGGHAEYQRRLADTERPVAWQTVFPRGALYPLIRLRLIPKHLFLFARRIANRLPPGHRARLARTWRWLRR